MKASCDSSRSRALLATAALLIAMIALLCSSDFPANAQTPPSATTSPQASMATDKTALKPAELEQMLAPIALYPDPLLTQMLMASTYPIEIVQADRWVKANKDLKGDPLAVELEKQSWDASVKSMVNFPEVLGFMSEKLDLTTKIGDAFISQQADVMNAIQKLRARAQAAGNLKSNEAQNVIVQDPSTQPAATRSEPIIEIEPAQPQTVYVPNYDPVYVYGSWPYYDYPPAVYYPPGYWQPRPTLYGWGFACGAAWGYAWGRANWYDNNVHIDHHQNFNYNRNIDRSRYQGNRPSQLPADRGSWRHDPAHRGGVAYPNQRIAQQYGADNLQAARAREQYRGRTDSGSTYRGNVGAAGSGINNPNRGNVANNRPANVAAQRPANRPAAAPSYRSTPTNTRNNSALNGINRGGSSARVESQRGQASRSASPARSAPSRSSGGGGSRGGGARGGGGRGGGGRR